jgi:CubicO group peptidase (beta-lactamase class C family)
MSNGIEIKGFCNPQFKAVQDVFAKNFEQFEEIGASLAVSLNGKFVMDIWAGYANAAKTRLWEENTIVCVFSMTKIMTSICILMLSEKDLLDLSSPVSKYWPEFGQNGKEKILIKHILGHTAGIPSWDEQLPQEDLLNWEKMTQLLEKQKPWWEPGTMGGYHAITFGYILGELVKRVTGKTIGTFFKENVAQPLGADFMIGIPIEYEKRMADLIPPDSPFIGDILEKDSIIYKILGIPGGWNLGGDMTKKYVEFCNTHAYHKAEIPASNGSANARSVVRIASAIACGGNIDDVHILSQNTLNKALEEQFNGKGHLFIDGIRYGTGFGLPSDIKPIKNPNTLYWGGWGGSACIMDMDAKLSISYVMNKMRTQLPEESRKNKFTSDTRANRIVSSVYEAL